MRLATIAAVLGVALLAPPPAPVGDAVRVRSTVGSVVGSVALTRWPAVLVAPRTLTALPGFRRTASGPVLDVQRFTTVAAFTLPAARDSARHAILRFTVRVEVPGRIALSVRAWCESGGAAPGAAPDGRSLRDVLIIGQNPVPGRAREQVASRTLTGRAVVDLPADPQAVVRCVAQLSPRTEALTRSTLRVVSGTFAASPDVVLVRAAQRPALIVGPRPATREVAATNLAAVDGAVRAEGEAELTTCALGYHLCGRGRAPTSVVDVVLLLDDVGADGRVCRAWRGSSRRVTITPAVHHLKIAAPSLRPTGRCGVQVRSRLRVTHVAGNPVEVEPTLGLPGGAVRVQTHTWISGATATAL